MNWISKNFRKLIILDADNPEVFENQRKKVLLNILLSIAIVFFSVFAVYNLFRGEFLLSLINFITNTIIAILFYIVQKKDKVELVSYIGTIYLGFHLILINIFNTDQIITLIWMLSYPIIVLFLLGRKKGSLLLIIFLLFFHTSSILLRDYNLSDELSTTFIIEYISAFILIFVLSMLFEYVRDKSQRKLVQSKINIDNVLKELKFTHEALVESELKYRSLIDIANDGIVIIQNNVIHYANNIAKQMVLDENDELIGKCFTDFLDPKEKDRVKEIHEHRLKSKEKIGTYETVIINSNGLKIHVEVNASVLMYEGVGAVIGILRDISQRKIYEEEREALIDELEKTRDTMMKDSLKLSEMNDKLIQSENNLRNILSTKDKFISILSHDLLNPISGIQQIIDLMLAEYHNLTDEEKLDILDTLSVSSKNINSLLENLLYWARMQMNSINIVPRELDLNFIALSSIDLLSSQMLNKEIRVISNIPVNSFVFADIDMINTVFRNLISNAIKFSPTNSEIVIDAIERDSKYEIHIIDKGVGIAQENLHKLFRIDARISTIGTKLEKGSGMGLILCKEFLEKNDGNIWVESTVGVGSIFKFTLPKVKK